MPNCKDPECCSCGGMPHYNIDFMFHFSPWMRDVPRIRAFLHKGHHFIFEKADTTSNTKWFEEAYPKWGKAMDAHAKATYPTFTWTPYYAWKTSQNHTNDINDPGYEKELQMLASQTSKNLD